MYRTLELSDLSSLRLRSALTAGLACQLFHQILRDTVEEPVDDKQLQIMSCRAEVVTDHLVSIHFVDCQAVDDLTEQ